MACYIRYKRFVKNLKNCTRKINKKFIKFWKKLLAKIYNMESTQIINSFNEEIIWETKKDLFDIYFKKEIMQKRYRFTFVDMSEKLEFDKGLAYLKYLE
jgi:hypothetical protein